MKIFVDTDSDIRLVRRLRRDISERGRDIEGVIKQYNKFVKPAFDQYIQPTMRVADIVVPWGEPADPAAIVSVGSGGFGPHVTLLTCPVAGSGNTVAIDLIVQHMHSQLEEVSQLGSVPRSLQPPSPRPAPLLPPTTAACCAAPLASLSPSSVPGWFSQPPALCAGQRPLGFLRKCGVQRCLLILQAELSLEWEGPLLFLPNLQGIIGF